MFHEFGNYTVELDKITPQVAKTLLEQNTTNRPITLSYVKFLVKQMKAGDWQMAGDPIKVSATGRILDGQHRLHAIIESDTTQEIFIMYNLPDESFAVMDTGRTRQAGDVLSIAGYADAKLLAATARMLVNYDRSLVGSILRNQGRKDSGAVSNQEVLTYVKNHDLTPYFSMASSWYTTHPIYSKAEYAFFFCILSRVDENQAILFLNAVSSGVQLEEDSPMYVLRKKLTDHKMSKLKLSPSERYSLTVKAWNLYRAKKTVKQLTCNVEKEELPVPK